MDERNKSPYVSYDVVDDIITRACSRLHTEGLQDDIERLSRDLAEVQEANEKLKVQHSKTLETRSRFYISKIRDRDERIDTLAIENGALKWAIKNFSTGA